MAFLVDRFTVDQLVGDKIIISALGQRLAIIQAVPIVFVIVVVENPGPVAVEDFYFCCLQTGAVGHQPQVIAAIAIGRKGFHWLYAIRNHGDGNLVGSRAAIVGNR